MNRFSLAAVGLLVATGSAFGIFDPNWERPLYRAQIEEVSPSVEDTFPLPVELTMQRRDGVQAKATSFNLKEDTGLRCITAPCPSYTDTQFLVTKIQNYRSGTVVFTAVEVLKPRPNVRLRGARILVVHDHMNSILKDRMPAVWQVNITTPGQEFPRHFEGNPEGVVTPEVLDR